VDTRTGPFRNESKTGIEQRLLLSPEKYSEPLRRTLKGYRKPRVGDYRIVLKIDQRLSDHFFFVK
jgi:mRNA interferase RelE/StbE